MKSVFIILSFFFVVTLFPCCEYVEGLYHEGTFIETQVRLEGFNSIQVETPIQLILEQTEEQNTVISGLDFKVDNLKFTVEDSTLVIESKEYAYSRKDQLVTVLLPVQTINKITLNVPTALKSKNQLIFNSFSLIINGRGTYSESQLNLNCNSVYVAAFGDNLGTHHLEGKTDNLGLTMEGLSLTNASLMMASKVMINQRSLKSSYVQAAEKLTVNMYSSGNVYYTGKPALEYKTHDPGWKVVYGQAIPHSE